MLKHMRVLFIALLATVFVGQSAAACLCAFEASSAIETPPHTSIARVGHGEETGSPGVVRHHDDSDRAMDCLQALNRLDAAGPVPVLEASQQPNTKSRVTDIQMPVVAPPDVQLVRSFSGLSLGIKPSAIDTSLFGQRTLLRI